MEELADAIDITYNMMVPCGYGVDQMESKEKGEIKQLKAQIDLLERYIKSKGYNIILHDDRITRNYMRSNLDRSVMEHETFK